MKIKEFNVNIENHNKSGISCENHENHKNKIRISCENHEHQYNPRMSLKNYETHENS